MKTNIFLLIFIGLILGGCSTISYTTDYDHSAVFTQYKTYSFISLDVTKTINQLNQQRIINSIKGQMKEKGFALVDSSSADLFINTHAITEQKQDVTATTNYMGGVGGYYGGWGGWGGGMSTTDVSTYDYTVGTLMVDIVDAKSKKLIWQGVGKGTIKKGTDKMDERIEEAITNVMASFPPAPEESK